MGLKYKLRSSLLLLRFSKLHECLSTSWMELFWILLAWVCTAAQQSFHSAILVAHVVNRLRNDVLTSELHRRIIHSTFGLDRALVLDALGNLQRMLDIAVSNGQMFAFRETWTEKDDDTLRDFAFSEDQIAEMRSRLPGIGVWRCLLRSPMAVVGNGELHSGMGEAIDSHPQVARFNDFYGRR